MLDISSNYSVLFSRILSVEDSPIYAELKNIFLPPADFVCKFQEAFGHYPKYAPLNICENPFIQIYVPGCLPDTVNDRIFTEILDLIQRPHFDTELDLTDAGFSNFIGLIGGDNARPMTENIEFYTVDQAFIPVNMLAPMFLFDQSQYPSLYGDLSCAFNSDSSGVFKVLGGELNTLDSANFAPGVNSFSFYDTSGFFAFSVDSPSIVSFYDMTILFMPNGNSEYLPTITGLLTQLDENIYGGL